MVGNVKYRRRHRRWEACVEYRDENGKRRCKSRYAPTEEEAYIGLRHLCEENAELLKASKERLLGKDLEVQAFDFSEGARTTKTITKASGYTCPSCNEEHHVRNKRVIRFEGATVGICRSCYKSGPVVVGDNLRKQQEAREKTALE